MKSIVFMCVVQELDYLAARKAGMKSLLLIRDEEKQVNIATTPVCIFIAGLATLQLMQKKLMRLITISYNRC